MPILHEYMSLRASVDLDTLFKTGDYGLEAPTNGPASSDFLVEVRGCRTVAVREQGQIAFSSVAENGDTVTVDDGTGTAVFTFAAAGNGLVGAAVNVATGATATDSAQNLRAAMNANTTINVSVTGGAGTITIVNEANYFGGAITKSDADNDYTVTDFTGGDDGRRTVQKSLNLATGAQQVRVYDGTAWGAWA
jgi:hypothetical protein